MTKVAENLRSTILLNDGVTIPLFGLGTFQCSPEECEKAALYAVENEYRLLDTAQCYENETDVGRAVKKCGLKREDLFVVSKLKWDFHGAEACIEAFKETLRKSVGVSNFNIHHLEGLKKAGCKTPSLNQFELHPWQRRDEVVRYCVDNDIGVMGYGRTVVQVLIRWSVQKGYITIPKSVKPARIKENSEVFDFTISDEDMRPFETNPTHGCTWDPLTLPFDE